MKSTQPTIGVLGGLGPHTTSVFYLDVVERATKQKRPSMCIYSVPVSLKKEQQFVENGADKKYFEHLLLSGLKRLEKAGSTSVVLPCNTLHEFHSTLSEQTSLNFPNLIDLVAQEIKRRGWKEIFLLATSRTVATGLYQHALEKAGIVIHTPSASDQRALDHAITTVLQTNDTSSHQRFLEELLKKAPCQQLVLGCTDLQLLLPHGPNTIDSTRVLTDHVVELLAPEKSGAIEDLN